MHDFLIVFCGKYLIYIAALALAAYWLLTPRPIKIELALTALIALPLAYALARVAGQFFSHQQPFATEGFAPLIPHAVDNAFPSDHATAMAVLSEIGFAYNRWLGAVLALLAIAVGFARVLAGLHYPIDIVAGYAIGIASAALAYYLVHLYFRARPHTVGHDTRTD